jgi:hypothetical protein
METIKKQVEKELSQQVLGHPSREDQLRIDRLERIVLKLAQQIDNLQMYKQDY